MPVRYEATAIKKCQFQGILWHPGRKYSGFAKPPEGLFEIGNTASLTEEAVEKEQEAKKKKAASERIPSDPTPRDRVQEAADAAAKEKGKKQGA
jgi:hypothetical protein